MELVVRNGDIVRRLFECVKDVLRKGTLQASETGLQLSAMDTSNAGFVSIQMNGKRMAHFHCPRFLTMGIDIEQFLKSIGKTGEHEVLVMTVDGEKLKESDSCPDQLWVACVPKDQLILESSERKRWLKGGNERHRVLYLERLDEERNDIPDYPKIVQVRMRSDDFSVIIDEISKAGSVDGIILQVSSTEGLKIIAQDDQGSTTWLRSPLVENKASNEKPATSDAAANGDMPTTIHQNNQPVWIRFHKSGVDPLVTSFSAKLLASFSKGKILSPIVALTFLEGPNDILLQLRYIVQEDVIEKPNYMGPREVAKALLAEPKDKPVAELMFYLAPRSGEDVEQRIQAALKSDTGVEKTRELLKKVCPGDLAPREKPKVAKTSAKSKTMTAENKEGKEGKHHKESKKGKEEILGDKKERVIKTDRVSVKREETRLEKPSKLMTKEQKHSDGGESDEERPPPPRTTLKTQVKPSARVDSGSDEDETERPNKKHPRKEDTEPQRPAKRIKTAENDTEPRHKGIKSTEDTKHDSDTRIKTKSDITNRTKGQPKQEDDGVDDDTPKQTKRQDDGRTKRQDDGDDDNTPKRTNRQDDSRTKRQDDDGDDDTDPPKRVKIKPKPVSDDEQERRKPQKAAPSRKKDNDETMGVESDVE